MSQGIAISRAAPDDPGVRALRKASIALMDRLFAPESNHYLTEDQQRDKGVVMFVARDGDATLGCCGLMPAGDYGEIKSLFTDDAARGRGVGNALLLAVEDEARRQGLARLCLETGTLLHAARRLYQRHGFVECTPFGDYRPDPHSVFMEKTL